jgi:hypothetical protein
MASSKLPLLLLLGVLERSSKPSQQLITLDLVWVGELLSPPSLLLPMLLLLGLVLTCNFW